MPEERCYNAERIHNLQHATNWKPLLCNLLASTKTIGSPDSFYRRQSISQWATKWGLVNHDLESHKDFHIAYLKAVIEAGKGKSNIFGLRLMQENQAELSAVLGQIFPNLSSDKVRFEKAFGRILYIHLSRKCKLAQAISLIKARQSGLWHIGPDGTEIERLAPHREPRYDFELIKQTLEELECCDAAWNSWFDQQNIKPFRLNYQSLSSNPIGALTHICKELYVKTPNLENIRPGVAKLADETSVDWVRRYRLDISAGTP